MPLYNSPLKHRSVIRSGTYMHGQSGLIVLRTMQWVKTHTHYDNIIIMYMYYKLSISYKINHVLLPVSLRDPTLLLLLPEPVLGLILWLPACLKAVFLLLSDFWTASLECSLGVVAPLLSLLLEMAVGFRMLLLEEDCEATACFWDVVWSLLGWAVGANDESDDVDWDLNGVKMAIVWACSIMSSHNYRRVW